MELNELRVSIDRVDKTIAELINERARFVHEIGCLKKDRGLEIYQPEREQEVLQRVRNVGEQGLLGPEPVARVFERIIEVCRELEGIGRACRSARIGETT